MLLQDIIAGAQFKISEGGAYMWQCYGPHARFMDFESIDYPDVSASCIFDTQNQTVYEASVYLGEVGYRWLNPDFGQLMYDESFSKDLDPRIYVDSTHYVDCQVESDFLEKLTDAFNTGNCNPDVSILLFLTAEQMKMFEKLPKDIVLEDFISNVMVENAERIKLETAQLWKSLINKLKSKDIDIKLDNYEAYLYVDDVVQVESQIMDSGLKNLNFVYSNKLTKDGLIHYLKDKELTVTY